MKKSGGAVKELDRIEQVAGKLEEAVVLGPMQARPELTQVRANWEMRLDQWVAQWIRAVQRYQDLRADLTEIRAEGRARRTAARHARTEQSMSQLGSVAYQRLRTYQRAVWVSRALIGLVVIALFWSAVNVQHNIAPNTTPADLLWWLSYGAELVVSGFVVALMLVSTDTTTWGLNLDRGGIILFELALMSVTIGLNAGPHLGEKDFGTAAQYSAAPLMIGTGMWLHGWISRRYATILAHADDLLYTEADMSAAGEYEVGEEHLALAEHALVDAPADGAEELDCRALAEAIVDQDAPADMRADTDHYERLVTTVEHILTAYADGYTAAEIGDAHRMDEIAVMRLINRAGQLLDGHTYAAAVPAAA